MTRRLFVCHANADIEATSEVVDALENALNFRAGTLWTSGLPGYSSEDDDTTTLRGALSGSHMILAIVTESSVLDPQFIFQLGAAWALGIHTVLYVLDRQAAARLPPQVNPADVVFGQHAAQWAGLIGDIALRLGLVPRPAASASASIPPSAPAQTSPLSPAAPAPLEAARPQTAGDRPSDPQEASAQPAAAPVRSYLDELRAIAEQGDASTDERTAPRHSYIEDLRSPAERGMAPAPSFAVEDEAETGEQPRLPVGAMAVVPEETEVDSDVFARLPTCEMALEAGRAVSDCVFNRAEIDDFGAELDEPLGRLVESLGASWQELRSQQDLDRWVLVTDQLLETLPDEVRKVEEWYRVGFELAILHNLAGQLVLDGSDAAAEQHWRGALERFLMRAERAGIGYENLGRVLGLLENLAGPSHERDLANIPRSLEELRRYAAGADIHSAA
jgi:hypothetical protein